MSTTSISKTPVGGTTILPMQGNAPKSIDAANMTGLKTDSIDFRSDQIARLAARMHEIPTDTRQFLLNPVSAAATTIASDPLCDLIVELLHSSGINETASRPLVKQSDLQAGIGLAQSLRWIYQAQADLGESMCHRIMLKSLMPMYLAAGQGLLGTGWADTISLIRSSCALIEMDRLTNNHDLAEWIRTISSPADPFESITKTFRVSVAKMAQVFWAEVSATQRKQFGISTRFVETKMATEKQHAAWWSLTTQFCEHSPQITVPADLAAGFIAWDKLSNHWQRVACAVSLGADGTETSTDLQATETSNTARKDSTGRKKECSGHAKINDRRIVEIRSAKDPQLSSNLEQSLMNARNEQGFLSLLVVKRLGTDSAVGSLSTASLQNWQSKFIEWMDVRGESANVRGFISDDGELTLVFQDVERSELAQWIRESFARFGQNQEDSKLATSVAVPLVAGVASVNAPSRSFKIEQLIQSAWRCLDGASTQGAGAVKTIEVY